MLWNAMDIEIYEIAAPFIRVLDTTSARARDLYLMLIVGTQLEYALHEVLSTHSTGYNLYLEQSFGVLQM
jgi:hypothetical protein